MNLLFITRRVDRAHPLAGFTWEWANEFSLQLSVVGGRLMVITLEPSTNEGLKDNVTIQSVRKGEKKRIQDFYIYCKLLLSFVPKCDAIIIHQHPVYAIVAAPFAKLFGKKIYLWYVHKQADAKLRLATALCNGIFTASKESFRLKTRKPVHLVGHGIATNIFKPSDSRVQEKVFTILSIGRISPVKGYEALIDAIQLTIQPFNNLSVRIVGGPGLKEHKEYEAKLKQMVQKRGLEKVIQFIGPVPHNEIMAEYRSADVLVNLSGTGSLDKAVLEAMACGVPVITSNEAFQELLSQIDSHLFVSRSPDAVAGALQRIIAMTPEARRQLGGALRGVAVRDHDLKRLVTKILFTSAEYPAALLQG